jgi:hypothetical protein
MPDDPQFEKYLERRAEQLGLPTDPAAYQDGGLAVAGTARNLPEAEVLATMLKANDIPAWVDSPLSALYAQGYQRPRIAVLVPLGRLADAQRIMAEHATRSPSIEAEIEKELEGSAGEAGEDATAQETAKPALRRPLARTVASIILLGAGLVEFGLAWAEALRTRTPWTPASVLTLGLVLLIGLLFCAAGIVGLVSKPKAP